MNTVYDIIGNDVKESNLNYSYLKLNNLNNSSSCYLTSNYYNNDFNYGKSYNLGFNSTDESTSSSFVNSDSNDSTFFQSYNYKQHQNFNRGLNYAYQQDIYNLNKSSLLNESSINNENSHFIMKNPLNEYKGDRLNSFSNETAEKLNKPKRRTRVRYNRYQLEKMEEEFRMNRYPDARRIEDLSKMLNLTFKNVTYWFQNRRSKLKTSNQSEHN